MWLLIFFHRKYQQLRHFFTRVAYNIRGGRLEPRVAMCLAQMCRVTFPDTISLTPIYIRPCFLDIICLDNLFPWNPYWYLFTWYTFPLTSLFFMPIHMLPFLIETLSLDTHSHDFLFPWHPLIWYFLPLASIVLIPSSFDAPSLNIPSLDTATSPTLLLTTLHEYFSKTQNFSKDSRTTKKTQTSPASTHEAPLTQGTNVPNLKS